MNEDEVQISGWAKNIVNEKWEKNRAEYKGQRLKTGIQITRETELEEKLQLRKIFPSCPSHQILEQDYVKNAQRHQELIFHRWWKKRVVIYLALSDYNVKTRWAGIFNCRRILILGVDYSDAQLIWALKSYS